MSAKKGRGAQVAAGPPAQSQKASPPDDAEAPNVSAIDKASFLEALQLNDGNPLHSTAMEEELNVSQEGRVDRGKAGRRDDPRTLKPKQRGAAAKRKATETDEENVKGEEEEEKKKKGTRRSTREKVKARPEKGGERKKRKGEPEVPVAAVSNPDPTPHTSSQPASRADRHVVGKRRSAGRTTAAGPLKKQQATKDTRRRRSESDIEKSNDPESQKESDTALDQQSRRRVLSSDEEEEAGEDTSWNPSPKEGRVHRFVGSRKSSSGSASAGAERSDADGRRRTRPARQATTDLEVVLDAFLGFCEQYRESVESKAVKQAIGSFSSHVKEQLLEKISSYKELRVLKKENAKVGSLLRKKTQRMLDAKHELMRAERQVWQLQKESAELKLRLADLRKSRAFLRDIGELNHRYLDHRRKRPIERETYGASSLAALLLEAKHVQAAEHQLRGINDRMEKRQKETGICK